MEIKQELSADIQILKSGFDRVNTPASRRDRDAAKVGARLVDSRSVQVPCSPHAAFRPIQRIGGQTGWYYGNWLWRLRGWIDLLVGGMGLRRGRRDPDHLGPGDAVDCWQVEAIEPNRLLRLNAQMKLPGRGWLQFEVEEQESSCTIYQTAILDPEGLSGLLYWYVLYPLHQLLFTGMLRGIVQAIEMEGETKIPSSPRQVNQR